MPATTNLVHSYRHLLRAGLRAVQFSKPSRYIIRDVLRKEFRDPRGEFEAEKARRTVWFLNAAAQSRGLEHKILKNLCRVHWERKQVEHAVPWRMKVIKMTDDKARKWTLPADSIKGTEFEHYDRTIAMLNDSMGLCLR
ncbi:hypothetical protein B0J18DRAFT_215650 [Chaetomium sp. MPI-SDFR-AT-0129]|nr:hypothetical protein B0J18DRAFT_215650 [Chaetomium sp. MPI-SDFR-AT-0129]